MSEDAEVRKCDQEQINEFGRLNNRLLEIRAEIKQTESDLEKMDDAVTDLMMVDDGKIMLFMGESFIETSEEVATEYCEKKVEKLKGIVSSLQAEEKDVTGRQNDLKKALYARFGNSINLEQS